MNRITTILRVENVSKSFGSLKAVQSVSFDVREGEILGIAGPNGAGKTTLFNIITGIPFSPDEGKIFLEGEEIQFLPPHVICKKGLGRTFQIENAFSTLTVLENVIVAATYGKRRRDSDETPRIKSNKVLDLIGFSNEKNRLAGELSLFDKKRLMIATMLVMDPKVLLLDEPTSGLNKEEIRDTMALIRKQRDEMGVAVVLIEHVLPVLLGLSDRVMILNQGSKIFNGLPEEVIKDKLVIEIYLGKKGLNEIAST